MDKLLQELLEEWHLRKLIQKFTDEEIDYEAFICLTPIMIQNLNLPIGLEAKLVHKLSIHKKELNKGKYMEARNLSTDQDVISGENSNAIILEKRPADEDAVGLPRTNRIKLSWSYLDNTKRAKKVSYEQEKTIALIRRNSSTSSNSSIPKTDFISLEKSPSHETTVGLETHNFRCSCIDFDVKQLLSEDFVGRDILLSYHSKEGSDKFLLPKERKIITHKVTNKAITFCTNLKHHDFIHISELIRQAFPTEITETYYIKCSGKMKQASGLLANYYRNLKPKLKNLAGYSNIESSPVTEDLFEECNQDDLIKFKEELHSTTKNFECIMNLWKKTSSLRIKFIMEQASGLHEVFLQFPIYRRPYGVELINADFKNLFPGWEDCLKSIWTELTDRLLSLMKRTFKDEFSQMMIKEIKDSTGNKKDFMVLCFLPKLLPPPCRKKGTSAATCRDSFLVQIQDCGDLESSISTKRTLALQNKTTVQPYLICIGKSSCPSKIFLQIDDISYDIPIVLHSFDLLFKTYMTFNLKYPSESSKLFSFFQRCVFRIETKYDNKCDASVKTLENDIRLSELF